MACFLHSVIVYKVTVRTGDKAFAGAEAKVLVTLYGKKGETEELYLDPKGQNVFNAGA